MVSKNGHLEVGDFFGLALTLLSKRSYLSILPMAWLWGTPKRSIHSLYSLATSEMGDEG